MKIVLDHGQSFSVANDVMVAWHKVEADVIFLAAKEEELLSEIRTGLKGAAARSRTIHPH